jgi:hypothetical protein
MNDRVDVAQRAIEIDLANVAPPRIGFEAVAAGEAAISGGIEVGRDQPVSLPASFFDDHLAEVSERTSDENAAHDDASATPQCLAGRPPNGEKCPYPQHLRKQSPGQAFTNASRCATFGRRAVRRA